MESVMTTAKIDIPLDGCKIKAGEPVLLSGKKCGISVMWHYSGIYVVPDKYLVLENIIIPE